MALSPTLLTLLKQKVALLYVEKTYLGLIFFEQSMSIQM